MLISSLITRIHRVIRYYRQPYNAMALVWSILVFGLLLSWFHSHGFDDPYITYRYAANIANGQGFVYNPGEQVLSTTAPFYALLLAGGAWLNIPLPLLSNTLGCLGLAAGSLMFWRFGQIWQTPTVGTVGLLLYPTFPLLAFTLGAETIVVLTLVLAALLACASRSYYLAAVLFALATLTRADSLIAIALASMFVLVVHVKHHSPLPWRAAGLYVLLLVPWVVFAYGYFGSPVPVTLAAKQQQGLMAISTSFADGLVARALYYWHTPSYSVHLLLLMLGVLGFVLCNPRWSLLIGWSISYAIAYILLQVTSYFWYYAPLVIGVLTLVGLGMMLSRQLVRRVLRSQRGLVGMQAVVLAVLLLAQVNDLYALQQSPDPRLEIYQAVGEWLRESTPADARVATLEVGIIGYYSQRTMIDFAGLIQPETSLQFTDAYTYSDAAFWASRTFQPDYIVLRSDALITQLMQASDVSVNCQEVQTFQHSHLASPLLVYHCRW